MLSADTQFSALGITGTSRSVWTATELLGMYAFTHKHGTQIVAEWLRDVALIEVVRHTDLTRHASVLSRSDTSETARPWHSRILQATTSYIL